MISELVGAAFAEGLREGRVPTIALMSQAALDAQRPKFTDKLEISKPQSGYLVQRLMYKGKDGRDYSTYEALQESNGRYMDYHYAKITRDPRFI